MYEFSKNIGEITNVEIDLRHELNLLNSEFSIDVLYIRNIKFVRCDCFDDLEKTGNPKCPKCFGSGYFASIQKFKAIESSISAYSSNNKVQVQPIGAIDHKDEVYYFEYEALPKERDFILKVSWKDGKPIDVIKVLEVTNVYEMRGTNGRIEVYGVHVNNKPDEVIKFNSVLYRLPSKAKRILGKGEKFIWPLKLLTKTEETI